MNTFKILICTAIFTFMATILGCKKENNEEPKTGTPPSSEQFITFKIDDQSYTFDDLGKPEDNYYQMSAHKLEFTFKSTDGLQILKLKASYFEDLSEPFQALTHAGSPPPANASFSFTDKDGKVYSSRADTHPLSIINVNPLSNDFIEGTFNLTLYLNGDNTLSKMSITDGTYKVKLYNN